MVIKHDFINDLVEQKFPLMYAFNYDMDDAPVSATVMASDGLYEKQTLKHFEMLYKIEDFKGRGGAIKEYLKPVEGMPRVPLNITATIFAFYRKVYEIAKTEVQMNVYWNRDHLEMPNVPGMKDWGNDIFTYIPKQEVTATRTKFQNDETYIWLIRNTIVLVDTHSHHTMEAFMSGTDSENSNVPCVYYDMGHIMSDVAHLHAWAAVDNTHIFKDLPAEELYKFMEELPHVDEYRVISTPVNYYSNRRFNPVTKKWELKPNAVETQPAASTKTLFVGTTEQFDSQELLKLAEEIPQEWIDQIQVPTVRPLISASYGANTSYQYQPTKADSVMTSTFDESYFLPDESDDGYAGFGRDWSTFGTEDTAFNTRYESVASQFQLQMDEEYDIAESLRTELNKTVIIAEYPLADATNLTVPSVIVLDFDPTGNYKAQFEQLIKDSVPEGCYYEPTEIDVTDVLLAAENSTLEMSLIDSVAKIKELDLEAVYKLDLVSDMIDRYPMMELTLNFVDSIQEEYNYSPLEFYNALRNYDFLVVDNNNVESVNFAQLHKLKPLENHVPTKDGIIIYYKDKTSILNNA